MDWTAYADPSMGGILAVKAWRLHLVCDVAGSRAFWAGPHGLVWRVRVSRA